jgi:polyisoprenoid-binding protein YceI
MDRETREAPIQRQSVSCWNERLTKEETVMTRRSLAAAVLALIWMAGALPAFAAETYEIDPVHSAATFKVKHLFTMVPGRFNTMKGTIIYDAKAVENSKVDVAIDATSINTDNEMRDKHLRSADFFEVEKYPVITFKSTKVKKVGEGQLEVTGDLTIRDVTRSVTLAVEILGFGPGPDGQARGGFHATTQINRMDYKVSWNKTLDSGGLLLGSDVPIDITVEGVKK